MASGSGYSQTARLMGVSTPLGEDALLLRSMTARERLSSLFEFELDLLSEDDQISPVSLLGQPATVRLAMQNQQRRYFNGYVSRFSQTGFEGRLTRYKATLVPWLWLLTRTSDCRIFQEMTVPDIIKQIFRDTGFSDVDDRLSAEYGIWEYCVQYRETHFNFVSRLMEKEGIYWYFIHEDGKHTLVLADAYSSHQTIPGYERVRYHAADLAAERDQDFIHSWALSSAIRSGGFVHDDFDFKQPSAELRSNATLARQHAYGDYEIYDYPGEYVAPDEGERYAGIRMEELQCDHEVAHGESYCRGLAVGHLFTLTDYPRADQNREYLLIAAEHQLRTDEFQTANAPSSGILYQSRFTATDAHVPFRASRATPKPSVKGPQSAIVVGPPGEEIWTDEYGRVKVQFHWDRYGQMDENSSCWIRVSHPWAGQNWGAISIPRIGQEVIVDFLEGDPDRPLITGRVYNAEQMPPFDLPAGAVVSGIKSNTHKGKGYNELTMDDTAGKEKITIHAQYDMNTTVEHDQTNTVHNTFTETITSDARISITQGTYSHDVQANTAKYHVQGALTENYDATQATTVKGAITIVSTGGPISVSSDAQHVYVNAATSIQLHVGASMIWMDSGGQINIQGTNVAINGSSSVVIKGGIVHSEAQSEHQTKGAIVLSEGAATNTVKGGMVMLNP
jgi:type VI secretion system secreted protein VgrG